MQCLHQSLCMCCFVLFSFLLCRFVSGSCPHTPVWRCQVSFAVNYVSFFIRHSVFSFFNSIPPQILPSFCFLLRHLYTMLPAFQACRKRFDHLLSLPAESFMEADPHVHCVHSTVHVHLDHRSISNISNVRILFIQHTNVSGSDNFLH